MELGLPVEIRDTKKNGPCSSSHKVSHDWLATLLEENRTNNRTIPPTLKTIAAAAPLKQFQAYESCYSTEKNSNTGHFKTCGLTTQVKIENGKVCSRVRNCVIITNKIVIWLTFSRQTARIHWLVHSHMTSNNRTVCRQKPMSV